MEPEGLHQDEVARVLARAVELAAVDADGPEGVPVWVVEAAAAEVGVEPHAVRQAVAELHAGLLPAAAGAAQAAGEVVVRRQLALPPAVVATALEAHLRRQRFVVVRQQPSLQRWRRRSDLAASVRRAADVRGRLQLQAVQEVVVRLVAVPTGTVVQVDLALRPGWRHAGWWGAAPGVVLGAGLAATALVTPIADVVALAAAPGGAAVAATGGALGLRARGHQRAGAAEELHGWLDQLDQPVPAHAAVAGAVVPKVVGRLQVIAAQRWSMWRVGGPPPPPPPPPPPV